jgi:hypothetical protein
MQMPGPFMPASKQAAHHAWMPREFKMGFPKVTQQAEDTDAAAAQQYDHHKNDDPESGLLWGRRKGFDYFSNSRSIACIPDGWDCKRQREKT